MKSAFVIYTFLLLLGGTLAWVLTDQGFLLAAVTTGLLIFSIFYNTARPLAEGTRLLTAATLTVAGPLQYQMSLTPLLLCFIAVPHFLAATQALSEQRLDADGHGHPKMRSLVFTIAFYTSMGLVFLLARGLEPDIPPVVTGSLAVLVLLVALPAWDHSRIPRLRRAQSSTALSARRWLLPSALLAGLVLLFMGPLPVVSDWLCRLSPHWRMNPVEFKNRPPNPPATAQEAKPQDDATQLGGDDSSMTGEHRLPPRSNLQPTEVPLFFIQLENPAQSPMLLQHGPLYVRSHTLNQFSDNKWTAAVSGGVWLEDGDDGESDGVVTLQKNLPSPGVRHEVFAMAADGYSLPAIAGLTAIHLPRVYAIPGELLQTSASGAIRYRADSSPSLYQALTNHGLMQPGTAEDQIHLTKTDGEMGLQLGRLGYSIFQQRTLLSDNIASLRAFLLKHYQYSTVMNNPNDMGALENFLFDERRGHCDFYATAAALLLREAGIPSRIAFGYATPEVSPSGDVFTVRERHAHAWTEILIKDHGWTICDFTPSDFIGQPTGTPPAPAAELPDPEGFENAADKVPVPVEDQIRKSVPFYVAVMDWFKQQTWLGPAMNQAPWVIAAAALLLLAWKLYRRGKTEDPDSAAAAARAALDQQPGYYREFLRISAVAGHPKEESLTPLEHFRSLQNAGLPVPPLLPLITYHCATRYEDAPRDPGQEQAFEPELSAFADRTAPPPTQGKRR